MKFGGSSLADGAQLFRVAEIVKARREALPFVVCSAHKGITDALVNAAREAARGDASADAVVERQSAIARAVGLDLAALEPFFEDLRSVLKGISLVREASPRVLDFVQSFGERMSVRTVAHAFRQAGLDAEAFDAFDLGFVTDAEFGRARPIEGYESRVKAAVRDRVKTGTVPVVTGFVGKTTEGEITTVGRNGSDFSATAFAAALGADECQIWTDTDGVMTADPSLCPSARNIPKMSFAEASELAQYGGRVLHPSTLMPAIRENIPVRVLNTHRPDHAGTVITRDGDAEGAESITSVVYKPGQVAITIQSATMLGQPGFLAEVFDILGRDGVDIDMVSTSEVSVSLTTSGRAGLERTLKRLERLGRVSTETERALLCVVGRQIRSSPGIAARVFGALERAGVNVEMISHGANAINLSMVIRDGAVPEAVRGLHGAFFDGV